MAKDNQVTVLDRGVNPGFLMDAWPAPVYDRSMCRSERT